MDEVFTDADAPEACYNQAAQYLESRHVIRAGDIGGQPRHVRGLLHPTDFGVVRGAAVAARDDERRAAPAGTGSSMAKLGDSRTLLYAVPEHAVRVLRKNLMRSQSIKSICFMGRL